MIIDFIALVVSVILTVVIYKLERRHEKEHEAAEEKAQKAALAEAARVFSALEAEPQHLSVLCERTGLSCDVLLVVVTELELTDRIASYSGGRYGLPKV